MLVRLLAAVVTSLNVFVSDGYHNGDRRGSDALSVDTELTWLRWDYFFISWILTFNVWLWGSHLGWAATHAVNLLSGAATALVGVFSRLATADTTHYGHTATISLMGLQYFGSLAYFALARPPMSAALALCALVYVTYGLGLAMWVLRLPRSSTFGYHEYFHMSVVAGHSTTMACDLAALSML